MNEDNEFWHWAATGAMGVLMSILAWWGKRTSDQLDQKVDKADFAAYLKDASDARKEVRESIIKLFERAETHENRDRERFEQLAKDFNGGLARLTDTVYTSKLEVLRELNGKVDK